MWSGPSGPPRLLGLACILLLVALDFSMALQLLRLQRPRAAATTSTASAAAFLRPSSTRLRSQRPPPPSSLFRPSLGSRRPFAAAASGYTEPPAAAGAAAEDLYDAVERALKGPCGVTEGGSRLVVAVSGGSDSVALLHLLAEIKGRWQPPLALSVAHFNHGLRLPAADEEAAFVQGLGKELGVPVHVYTWSDAERAKPTGVQARSRAWRRAECRRLLLQQGDGEEGFVVTAHQADDQMETWALKLLRGAHLSHLRGMAYRSLDGEGAAADEDEDEEDEEEDGDGGGVEAAAGGPAVTFIKPLLDVPKARLVRFLETRGLEWREDASNAVAGKYKRNRVRLQLLPLMAELAGGEAALRARIGALSAQSGALDGWLAAAAAEWEEATQQQERGDLRPNELWIGDEGGGLGAPSSSSSSAPRLVQEEVVHRFVARATGGALRALPYAQVDRVLGRLARDAAAQEDEEQNGAIEWRLFLARGWVLDRQASVLRVSQAQTCECEEAPPLAFPDAGVELVGLPGGWHARAERLPPDAAAEEAAEAKGMLVLHGLPQGTRLRCRRRRDGDRFHPAWRPGPIKLKDFLRGQRVPLHRRDEVLLVCLEEEGDGGGDGSVVAALVDPPFVARPFCGGVASSSEPGAAALALRIAPSKD